MKTRVEVIHDVGDGDGNVGIREGETGYIDGYTRGGDGKCWAMFVRDEDDMIYTMPIRSLKKIRLMR